MTIQEIAKVFLGIEDMKIKNSDSSDFHELGIWQIRDALNAAYEAGRMEEKKKNKLDSACGG